MNKKRDIKYDEAKGWCHKEDIKVYPVPITNNTLQIEISYKGKTIKGKKEYDSKKNEWVDAINGIYLYYFENPQKL